MGRWLDALKIHENGDLPTRQNRQNLNDRGFVSFVGEASEQNHDNSPDADGVLSVLSGPISREIKNLSVDEPPFPDLPAKSDAEFYADALQQIGPCGYGPIAVYLGWGATRAGQAETVLRLAGKIVYDRTGRGKLAGE